MHALEKKVLELIGEDVDSPDVFTDDDVGIAPIRDSLNDAIQEIVMLEGSNKRQYLIPLRANQTIYKMVPDNGHVGWVTDVILVNKKYRLCQTSLQKLAAVDPRWMITAADPREYFPVGTDAIGVYPKASASSDMLEVTVVEIPFAYHNQNAKVRLKDDFAYAAIHYAVSEYWASRGDANEAVAHYERYLDAMKIRHSFEQSPQRYRRFRNQSTVDRI